MRSRALPLLLAALLAWLAVPAAPAGAEPPSRLATQVTDPSGALGGGRAATDDALARLQSGTGVQLFVVFVDSFDGVGAQEWTDRTAQLSDLGDRDALLAVATTDRAYAYSLPGSISAGTAERVARDDIEPALRRSDWSGAVVAAADGFGSSGGTGWWLILIPFALLVVAALLWARARRRQRPATPAPAPGPSLAELSDQANALLIELDDDLGASERELDLATGQYGPEATTRYRAALDASRQDVAEAFRLRMTLDSEPAPDDATRHRVLTEIIARCRAADDRLDAESEAFDRLRDLESRAPAAAAEVDRRRASLQAALPAAGQALQTLTGRYSGSAVQAVTTNVTQATERLTFTTEALATAQKALTAPAGATSTIPGGSRAEAALAVRAAEQAVDQAEQLVAAIHRTTIDLDAARTAADSLITEVESELVAARATPATPALATPALAAAVPQAEQTLTDVRAQLSTARPDVAAAAARLQAADAALDQALAAARDAAVRAERARALLATALPAARAELTSAADYVNTRRGAVSTNTRASLSEANRHLITAEQLASADPIQALAEAQQAQQLAATATRAALTDVNSWSTGSTFDSGSFAGAVLGGILSNASRSRGPWSSNGYGGSSSHTRRTGGGRF